MLVPGASHTVTMASPLRDMIRLYDILQLDSIHKQLLLDAEALSHESVDNFWMPKDVLESGACQSCLEAFIAWIYDSLMRKHVKTTFSGVEYWVQVRQRPSSAR